LRRGEEARVSNGLDRAVGRGLNRRLCRAPVVCRVHQGKTHGKA
jgi:hypothetical protein